MIAGLPSREAEWKAAGGGGFYIDGHKQKNKWVYYKTYYYHVDGDGIIQKNQWIELRYVGEDGRMYRGRQTPDGKWVGDDGLAVDTTSNVQTALGDNVSIEGANVYQNLDGSIQIGGTPQEGAKLIQGADNNNKKFNYFEEKEISQAFDLDQNIDSVKLLWVKIAKKYIFIIGF